MKRVTLEEIGRKHLIFHVPKKVEIEGQEIQAELKMEYELDFEAGVAKGGTCLVYHAYKIVKSSKGFLKHKVILKEFYPELETEETMIVRREDGSLEVSDAVKEQDAYRTKLERFRQSYEMFVNLHNEKKTNNYVVNADELIEANGTWYLVIDYNEACTLSEYMEKQLNLYEFCQVLRRVAGAVSVLHEAGYLHLDLTPGNLMVFPDGSVCLLDTDSFLRKDELRSKRPVLSWSEGYAAPELLSPRAYQRLFRLGERSDIFSLGAILYRYLYGEHFEGVVDEKSLEEKIEEKYAFNQETVVKCPQNAMRTLKDFISIALSVEMGCRYETMREVEEILEGLLPLIEPKRIQLLDNFRENANRVYGREEKIKELEEAFGKQGQQGKHRLVMISGIGGIGKSTLARAYAEKYLEQYDTIVEVAAESAEEVVRSIGIINFDDNRLEERIRILQALLQERKCLFIVHDYNQREDDSFALFKEFSCDVILTSWADWKESGVSCVSLKSNDLTEQAVVCIFEEIYLKNAQSDCETLKAMLAREREFLKLLLHQVDYHPLTIKLLAKQMSYLAGAEQTPSQMLKELEQYGISENHDVTFQNQKDAGNVELGNVFFHLQKIYGMALQNGRLTEEEIEVLRYMMLLSGENGVCIRRFVTWTYLYEDGEDDEQYEAEKERFVVKVLASLYKKGWIEYKPWQIDQLWLETDCREEVNIEAKGVYHMQMCVSQVLYCQERMTATVWNCSLLLHKLLHWEVVDFPAHFKEYSTVKYVLEYVERLCKYIKEEQSINYAFFLEHCSLILVRWVLYKNKREEAMKKLEIATQMSVKLSRCPVESYSFYSDYKNLAEGYFHNGQYAKAIVYAQKSIECVEENLEKRGEADWSKDFLIFETKKSMYNLLTDSYLEIGNYENAAEVLIKRYLLEKEQYDFFNGFFYKMDEMYIRLGKIELLKGNLFLAIEYWELANEEYTRKFSDGRNYKKKADLAYCLAQAYWEVGWRSKAIDCLENCLKFYNQDNEQTDAVKNLLKEYQWEFSVKKDDVRKLKDWYCKQLRFRRKGGYYRIRRHLKELRPFLDWWERVQLWFKIITCRMKVSNKKIDIRILNDEFWELYIKCSHCQGHDAKECEHCFLR